MKIRHIDIQIWVLNKMIERVHSTQFREESFTKVIYTYENAMLVRTCSSPSTVCTDIQQAILTKQITLTLH